MKHKYRTLLIITCILFVTQIADSQIFSIRPGKMYYNSKTIIPVLGQMEEFNLTDYFSFHFDYFPTNNKLQLGIAYSFYRGSTDFSIDTKTWGMSPTGGAKWAGNGVSATSISRYAIKFGYNLKKNTDRLKVYPQLRLIFENAKATSLAGQINYINVNLDKYYNGPITFDPLNSFQILPALGIDLDWNFWWRLHFVYSTYYAWGHKPFQKYYFEYTYQGVPQPTAEWHSDGTGWFFSVGLGMTIFGYKKEKITQKRRD